MSELNVTTRYISSGPIEDLRLQVTLRRVDGHIGCGATVPGSEQQDDGHEDFSGARIIGWQEKLPAGNSIAPQVLRSQAGWQPPKRVPFRRSVTGGAKQGRGRSRLGCRSRDKHNQQFSDDSRKIEVPAVQPHIFTHTHAEGVLQRTELQRAVVTGQPAAAKLGAMALAVRADAGAQLRHSQLFGILADCGPLGGRMMLTLVTSHEDGSFDMRPGVSAPGSWYRQQDKSGVLWEWRIELEAGGMKVLTMSTLLDFGQPDLSASQDLQQEVEQPEDSALRVLLAGELVAGWGFPRRRVYVEYRILYDPGIWRLLPRGRPGFKDTTHPRPGIVRGVTQVSTPQRLSWRGTAHFAHPLAFDFELLVEDVPAPPFWPTIYFQVCAWRRFGRHTTEGYGWLSLNSEAAAAHKVSTWRPARSFCQALRSACCGGSRQLADISYTRVPATHQSGALSRFGFHGQSSGTLQVRMQQLRRWVQRPQRLQQPTQPPEELPPPLPPGDAGMVMQTARSRLQEAPPRQVHPPVLIMQPSDLRVMLGRVAEFCVHATGAEPLEFQWHRDGRVLKTPTASTRILCISHAALDDAGGYVCTVSNRDGAVDSRVARLEVNEPELLPSAVADETQTLQDEAGEATQTEQLDCWAGDATQTEVHLAPDAMQTEQQAAEDSTQTLLRPPSILQHPENVSVMEGNTFELAVEAEGDLPLQYQWLRASMPLQQNTQRRLRIQQAALTDAASYACRVLNEQGSVTSDAASVTVEERGRPPNIMRQSRDALVVVEGDPINLAVEAEGRPPISYRWSCNEKTLPHQTAATLTIDAAVLSDAGSFCCRVSNPWGWTDSSTVAVSVLAAGPTFIEHPQNLVAEEGGLAVLRAQATARRSFAYRWVRSGTAIPGATTAQLRFSSLALTDSGEYTCEASNRWGTATSALAVLEVEEVGGEPFFVDHPRDAALVEGSPLHLTAKAEGKGDITLQWLREGRPIPGAVGPLLRIQGMGLADGGTFACRALNARGIATSRSATVTVTPRRQAPRITQQPQSTQLDEGHPFVLSVAAEGSLPLTHQWQYGGRRLRGETSPELRVQAAAVAASGQYACVVRNAAGATTSDAAVVTVRPRGTLPRILQQPSDSTVEDGQPLRLLVAAAGDPPLQHQWLRDGVPLPAECHAVLDARAVTSADTGIYSCQVSNAFGSVTSSGARVTVTMPPGRPVIVRQPAGCSVPHLGSFGLSVLATGDPPLTYQWWVGNSPVAGAMSPILAVTGARKAMHQGLYTVQVSNGLGAVVSEEALVEVEALDILSIIEHFVEDRQITFKSLFMQFNRSADLELGPRELEALVAAVYPECLPSEFRHFQVVVDTEGRGRYSYKQLMMALKEAKGAGHWLEGSPDIRALLSALAVRLQEQGRDFRKVFEAFDVEGEGSLGYEGVAALVRRQLPDLTPAELRGIMSHIHLLDKDGDGRLTCEELWEAVRHAPVGPAARRDLRRVAGLAKTPAEKEMALRRSSSVRQRQ